MTSARYWRLTGVAPRDIGANLALSDIALYDGAARVDGAAAISCTATPIAGTLAALADGSTATSATFAAADATAPGFALVWDFGVAQAVNKLALWGPADGTFPMVFLLSYSADGQAWVPYMRPLPRTYWSDPDTPFYLDTALGDQHYGNVALFLRGSDISGVQRVTDVSLGAGEAITLVGGTRAALLGDGSAVIDFGTSDSPSNTLRRASPFTDIELPGDFTIDFWLSPRGYSSQWGSFILDARTSGTHNGMVIMFGYGPNGNKIEFAPARGDGTHISIKSDSAPALNVETHVEFYRSGNTVGMLINGVAQAETGTLTGTVTYQQFRMGSSFNDAGSTGINGYIRDFRITAGVARHTAGFTPSIAVAGYAGQAGPMNNLAQVVVSGPNGSQPLQLFVPSAFAVALADPCPSIDSADGGTYQITGTVKEKATPANTPLARKVQLYHQTSGRLVRETWSAASDGSYSFTNIRGDQVYFVVAFDHTGTYRAVIADSQTAQAMPL